MFKSLLNRIYIEFCLVVIYHNPVRHDSLIVCATSIALGYLAQLLPAFWYYLILLL